jgi:hypothetical protein
MTPDPSWSDLAGSLPVHQDEVMGSHEGRPTIAQQSADGRPLADIDLGQSDEQKYGGQ